MALKIKLPGIFTNKSEFVCNAKYTIAKNVNRQVQQTKERKIIEKNEGVGKGCLEALNKSSLEGRETPEWQWFLIG